MKIEDKLLVEVATLELIIRRLRDRCKKARAVINAELRPGNRADAVDPLDESRNLAIILKTKPDKQVWVSDQEAFAEWVRANYKDKVRNDFEVVATQEKIKALLYTHDRENGLRDVSVVDAEFEAEVLAQSRKFGAPVGPGNELDVPGITVQTPPSELRCVPDPLGAASVEYLLRSGQIDLMSLVLDEPAEAAEVPE